MHSYTALARSYDRMHKTWLRHAGGTADIVFEAAVLAEVRPETRVLDAGAGTGVLARRMLAATRGQVDLTLLDKSAAMLAEAADLDCPRVVGCLMEMPFEDARFDLVSLAWSLEATPVPRRVAQEALRVLRPGGSLVAVFCSDAPAQSLAARVLRFDIQRRGLGRFLAARHVCAAFCDAGASEVITLRTQGPASVVLVRKASALAQRAA